MHYKNESMKMKKQNGKQNSSVTSPLTGSFVKSGRISEITNSVMNSSTSFRMNLSSRITNFDGNQSAQLKPKSSLMSNLENMGVQQMLANQKNTDKIKFPQPK